MLALIGASKPWGRASSQLPTMTLPQSHQGSTPSWLRWPGLLLQTALPGSRTLSVMYTKPMLALAGIELIFFPAVGICDKHKCDDKRCFHYC